MRHLIRPTLAITGFTIGGQAITLALQIVVASLFGATSNMDAYLAAITLPTYVSTVLLGGLSYVFVPLFVRHRTQQDDGAAWHIAHNIISLYLVVGGGVVLVGILSARPLLALTVPGLSEPTLKLATGLMRILWPSVLLSGLASLCIGLYQAYERFVWPAVVPLVGGSAMLVIVSVWGRHFGIHTLAVALLVSSLVQAVLLVPIIARNFSFSLNLRHPGVQEALRLLTPLVIGAFFAQSSKLVDRFVASGLASGSISHLAYSEKITALFAAFLSGGIAVTFFPQMARQAAQDDVRALRTTLSTGLRFTWFLVAPAIGLGIGLAYPLVGAFLQRGAFHEADTAAVSSVLHWYLLSLLGMSWGNITARTFYAFGDTKTLSVIGVAEVGLYALYAPWLGKQFGVSGIGAAVMIYWNLSVLMHCALLWPRLGRPGIAHTSWALARIAFAALAAGMVAHLLVQDMGVGPPWQLLAAGGVVGLGVYMAVLHLLRAREWTMVVLTSRQWIAHLRERPL